MKTQNLYSYNLSANKAKLVLIHFHLGPKIRLTLLFSKTNLNKSDPKHCIAASSILTEERKEGTFIYYSYQAK
jgi:hypothetical protein